MTCKLLPTTTVKTVELAKKAGAIGFKLYPCGATTNSHDGIPEEWLQAKPCRASHPLYDVFSAIQDNDMVLLQHGEMPGSAWTGSGITSSSSTGSVGIFPG